MGFRYDIQGLRALAVLLVFIFYLNSSWLPGGFVGVDIFFVISGFLVGSIILHKKDKGTFSFVDFYVGRIKRIVPVFLLFLLFVIAIGMWIYLGGDIKSLRMNIFQAFIFNSNNYLASLDNYFGASSQENPLLHTWTLSIEMQFYFLLPLFLMIIKKKYLVSLSVIIILLLLSYSFYNSTFLNNQSAMYFSLIARIPEFLIGTVFAVKANDIKAIIGKNQDWIATICLIGIVVCGIFYTEYINFPGLWVVLPCVFAGIILITKESKVNIFFSNKILVHIGELSYSIYLWHWAIMAFVRYYYVRVDFIWYEMIGIIILTYVLSWLSYTYVENVFRTFVNKKFFIQFFGVLCLLGVLSFLMPQLNYKIHKMPLNLIWHSFGTNTHGVNFSKPDTLGDLKSKKVALFIGDSHALSYKGFLDEVGKRENFKFISITNSNYPPIKGISNEDFSSRSALENYSRLCEEVDSYIEKVDLIFVATTWSESAPSLPMAFVNFADSLKSSKKIILISDFPELKINPIRFNRSIFNKGISVDYGVYRKELKNEIVDVLDRRNNIYYMELDYDKYLNELPYYNDTVMYFDSTHLNYYGSIKFSELFKKEIHDFFNDKKIFE